ncbi:permeability factor 2-like [Esox lucius]|uniref:Chemokine interleukin-8-like domain-containing protein n=2 Tax=Esox lucius TaxID=8010 RepID=A0AAY5JZN5_ESOLU|nr:permeability factor 2-like [Esox lucius]
MKTSIRMLASLVALVLFCLTITEGMSLSGISVEPRCRCIKTESRRVGNLIAKVEIFPPSPHCKDTEIIATLKTHEDICLDPNAPWVKRFIDKLLAKKN